MSGDINRWVGVGRLTRDAELTYTNTGFALTKFSIAINRRKKEGDAWVDEANFFDCQIWGKRGEALNQYLLRGQQVAIEGELRQERWEKEGVKRSKVSIEATNIQLLGGNKDGAAQQQGGSQQAPPPNDQGQNFQNPPPSGPPQF
ncbi:single-stranded DNA-binding protein [Candidatus Pacearchaeota archaeon]|nr:single-stranded DNA-binding protein [Candidatus Pacearchaeota archaeon]